MRILSNANRAQHAVSLIRAVPGHTHGPGLKREAKRQLRRAMRRDARAVTSEQVTA